MSGERPGARDAIDRVALRILEQDRSTGARSEPLTRDEARQTARDIAIRHDRRRPR